MKYVVVIDENDEYVQTPVKGTQEIKHQRLTLGLFQFSRTMVYFFHGREALR